MASMVVMMAASTISAQAAENRNDGTWKQNQTGWWYEFVDGSYLTNDWYWVDGNMDNVYECYYFDRNGYMAANTSIGSDMVDANGAWVVNGIVQTKQLAVVKDQVDNDVDQYVPVTRNTEKSKSDTVALPTTGYSVDDIMNAVDWSTGTSTCGGKSTFNMWH